MADEHSFIYVDDSGDDKTGASMSALVIPGERWSQYLGFWMGLRSDLEARFELPKHFEIHSNAFLSAHPLKDVEAATHRQTDILKSRVLADPTLDTVAIARAQVELADIALNQALAAAQSGGRSLKDISSAARLNAPDVNDRLQRGRSLQEFKEIKCLGDSAGARTTRRTIYDQLLDQIASFPDTRVLTVCAQDGSKGTIGRIYSELLRIVETLLAADERWGTVVVDGTPSARTQYYRDAHRELELTGRRVLEDEVLRDSSESHFIQMADICAHSAFGLRQDKPERYVRLSRVVHTASGETMSGADPGFFMLPVVAEDGPATP